MNLRMNELSTASLILFKNPFMNLFVNLLVVERKICLRNQQTVTCEETRAHLITKLIVELRKRIA